MALFVVERVQRKLYQNGFNPQKVKDLCFKPVLELHKKQLYSFPKLTSHILQCTAHPPPDLPMTSSPLTLSPLPVQFIHLRSLAGWRGL